MKRELVIKIPEQTKFVTIEVENIEDVQNYLDGCLDANIHPQGNAFEKGLSPQGEHSGLDSLECVIADVTQD